MTLPAAVLDGRVDFTFAAWLRIDALRGDGHFIMSYANASDANALGISYDESRDGWRFGIGGSASGSSISVADDALDIAAGGLVFGQDQDTLCGGFEAEQSWAGAIDNLRIYSRALNAGEIETLAGEAH